MEPLQENYTEICDSNDVLQYMKEMGIKSGKPDVSSRKTTARGAAKESSMESIEDTKKRLLEEEKIRKEMERVQDRTDEIVRKRIM